MTIDVPEIVAVLIGQHDGEVFIPDAALTIVRRSVIEIVRDDERAGYVVRLRPAVNDGSGGSDQ